MPPKKQTENVAAGKKEGGDTKANIAKRRTTKKGSNGTDATPRRSARTAAKQMAATPIKDNPAPPAAGTKRKSAGIDDKENTTKKQKSTSKSEHPRSKSKGGTIGSKHDKPDAPAAQGSIKRLPMEGSTAHWKAMPGWVSGQVLQILTRDKDVEGKKVKASEEDPRIVLKSSAKSGKICVHKPGNVYFDD